MHLDVGQTFSVAVTDDLKLYTWGLNDFLQLGRSTVYSHLHSAPDFAKPLSKLSPKQVACGDDHGLLLDYNGNVYTWGANQNGQLGVGNSRYVSSIVNLKRLGKNIKYIATQGKTSYVINEGGNVLKWPNPENVDKFTPCPVQIRDPSHKFVSISCGTRFAIALTNTGLLFGHGKNEFGQLGLGDYQDRDGFVNLKHFKDHGNKITQISCGHAHAVARNSSGAIFSWGLNANGQLGTGNLETTNLPKSIRIYDYKNNSYKVRCAQAGYASTNILCEDKRVYFAGVDTTTIKDIKLFTRLNYENKIFKSKLPDDYSPVKLYTKWSHSIQVTYMVYADFRGCSETKLMREKILQNIVRQWESCYHQTLPPFDDKLAKSFSQKYMKKEGTGDAIVTSNLKKTQTTNTNMNGSRMGTQNSANKHSTMSNRQPSAYDSNFKSNDSVLKHKLEQMMNKDTRDFTAEEKRLMEKIRAKQLN